MVGVVAVDGGDQPGPGRLDQASGAGPAAVAKAAGQPLGQAQVGQDDPLSQLGVAAGGVGLQPSLDFGRGVLVAWADVQDRMVGKLGDGGDTRHLVGFVHEGCVDGAAAKQWVVCLCRWFANLVGLSAQHPPRCNCPGKPSRQHDQQIW